MIALTSLFHANSNKTNNIQSDHQHCAFVAFLQDIPNSFHITPLWKRIKCLISSIRISHWYAWFWWVVRCRCCKSGWFGPCGSRNVRHYWCCVGLFTHVCDGRLFSSILVIMIVNALFQSLIATWISSLFQVVSDGEFIIDNLFKNVMWCECNSGDNV